MRTNFCGELNKKFGGEISHMVPLCVEEDLKKYFN